MLAQLDLNAVQSKAGINLSFSTPAGLISNVLPFIFGAAGFALLIYLVMGGFQIMLSRGDPKAVQGGQGKITNAIIGFVIIITAFLLTRLAGQIFGVSIFSGIFGGGSPGITSH